MKRLPFLILTAVVLSVFAACGSGNGNSQTDFYWRSTDDSISLDSATLRHIADSVDSVQALEEEEWLRDPMTELPPLPENDHDYTEESGSVEEYMMGG